MSFLLKTDCTLEAVAADKSFSLFLRNSIAGLNISLATQYTLSVPANGIVDISAYGLSKVNLIAVESTNLIDLCISRDEIAQPIWTNVGSNLHIRIVSDITKGWDFTRLSVKNLNPTTVATVRVLVAGMKAV